MLTEDNYYDNDNHWKYMSVSQFKDFMSCEAKAMAKLNKAIPKENTEAFLVGNYVHSAFENEKSHETFLTNHESDMLTKAGKIDCLNVEEGYFVDLKTTADIGKRYFSPRYRKWVSFVEEYGYVLQMAIYKILLGEKYNKEFTPYIYAVSKQDPPNVQAIDFINARFTHELEYVEQNIEHILKVKFGEQIPTPCGSCDYCRANKVITGFIEVEELIDKENINGNNKS
ncbi:PD-(D/E)XK nuclease-like domain-containing protein [Vagococcus carniphilus]|uniref:PD-(D/E)XK nuclease-like domain-containing protein n=1 Tax=Vagococcus carniphilus TaxID=218144 RepID=UPI00289036A4|nr:PD-(D/E)XK nuclease-like domain-containing protein [Vagococcus carniphilus]MDT2813774.1 PD-(D/E)XK nuclease-like domain-containing protein [Vagococcus carniphilus]